MTDENPYAAPLEHSAPVHSPQGANRLRLLNIARAQKMVLHAVLFQLGLIPLTFLITMVANEQLWGGILLLLAATAVVIFGAVAVFRLSLLLNGTFSAVIHVIGLCLPLIGLLVLLSVNSKATIILKEHGVHVGFMGANPDKI